METIENIICRRGQYEQYVMLDGVRMPVRAGKPELLQERLNRLDETEMLYGAPEARKLYNRMACEDELHYAPGCNRKLMDGFRALNGGVTEEGVMEKTWEKVRPVLLKHFTNVSAVEPFKHGVWYAPEDFAYATTGHLLARIKLSAEVKDPRNRLVLRNELPGPKDFQPVEYDRVWPKREELHPVNPDFTEAQLTEQFLQTLLSSLSAETSYRRADETRLSDCLPDGMQSFLLRDFRPQKNAYLEPEVYVPGPGCLVTASTVLAIIRLFVALNERPEAYVKDPAPNEPFGMAVLESTNAKVLFTTGLTWKRPWLSI
jgi:hypothetical protein